MQCVLRSVIVCVVLTGFGAAQAAYIPATDSTQNHLEAAVMNQGQLFGMHSQESTDNDPSKSIVPASGQEAIVNKNLYLNMPAALQPFAEPVARFRAILHTPFPAAVWLFGSGILGIIGYCRRVKHGLLFN